MKNNNFLRVIIVMIMTIIFIGIIILIFYFFKDSTLTIKDYFNLLALPLLTLGYLIVTYLQLSTMQNQLTEMITDRISKFSPILMVKDIVAHSKLKIVKDNNNEDCIVFDFNISYLLRNITDIPSLSILMRTNMYKPNDPPETNDWIYVQGKSLNIDFVEGKSEYPTNSEKLTLSMIDINGSFFKRFQCNPKSIRNIKAPIVEINLYYKSLDSQYFEYHFEYALDLFDKESSLKQSNEIYNIFEKKRKDEKLDNNEYLKYKHFSDFQYLLSETIPLKVEPLYYTFTNRKITKTEFDEITYI